MSWASDHGDEWPTPRLPDTLALCYLGCLLLRIPCRIGDMVRWAKGGNIAYRHAVRRSPTTIHIYDTLTDAVQNRQLPQDMWDRLPATYQKLFQTAELANFEDGELHSSIMNLAISFNENYGMIIPPLNEIPAMLLYVRELGLPSKSSL